MRTRWQNANEKRIRRKPLVLSAFARSAKLAAIARQYSTITCTRALIAFSWKTRAKLLSVRFVIGCSNLTITYIGTGIVRRISKKSLDRRASSTFEDKTNSTTILKELCLELLRLLGQFMLPKLIKKIFDKVEGRIE